MCRWRDVIAGSSALSQNQQEIASTVNCQTDHYVWKTRSVISVSAKFQVQNLCCLPEISKCIGAELLCLLVKGLNSV